MKIPKYYPKKGVMSRRVLVRRYQIAQRDGAWCCVCGEDDENLLTVDHLISRARGGKDEIANMNFLCKPCHTYKDGFARTKPWFYTPQVGIYLKQIAQRYHDEISRAYPPTTETLEPQTGETPCQSTTLEHTTDARTATYSAP